MGKTRVEKGDIAVARAAKPVRGKPVVRIAGEASEIADQPPLLAITAGTMVGGIVARNPRMTVAGTRMLATFLVATAIKTGLKRAVDRTRPALLMDKGEYRRGKGRHFTHDYNSFPSGHTAGAVAVAQALRRDYPRAAGPALGGAALVAAAQVPRGKHYVSDVVAGAVIGAAADWIVNAVVTRRRSGRTDEYPRSS